MGLLESRTVADGGITALLVPKQLSPKGLVLGTIGMGLVGIGKGMVDAASRKSYGRISYEGGMARMTGTFNSRAVESMMQGSGGNYSAFSDMAQHVVKRPGLINALNDNGATPQMIAALYHMGGR